MSEYEKINLVTHAQEKFFKDEISEKEFKGIVDELSKDEIGIVKQKFEEMYKKTLKDKKSKKYLEEKSILSVSEMLQYEDDDNID